MFQPKNYFSLLHDQYLSNKELGEVYLSFFLRSISAAMISVFMPIFLLTIGFELFDVVIYSALQYISCFVLFPFSMMLGSKLGIKKIMALGTFVLILFYWMIGNLTAGDSYILVAFTWGASIALYYAGFHIEFTIASKGNNEGKQVSMLQVIARLASIIGPVLGSLIIAFKSFEFLFIFVSIPLALSIVPLFFSKDFKFKSKISPKSIVKADDKYKGIAYQTSGALGLATGLFWPIFIFLVLDDIISLGLIVSVTSIILMFVISYIGQASDKSPTGTLKFGILAHSSTWPLKLLLLNPMGLFFTNFLSAITNSTISISFQKHIYAKAEKTKDLVNYFIFRELHLMIGRLIILFCAFAVNDIIMILLFSTFIPFGFAPLLKNSKKGRQD